MAWADTLLDASFRGIVFDILDIDDTLDRALAEHAYPYLAGADIEDLGAGPRGFAVHAIFFGDDYEARLQAFLAALDAPGAGELVHPVFGSVKSAQVRGRSVHHSADGVDQATVAVQFVESTPADPFYSRSMPTQKAAAVGAASDDARLVSVNSLSGLIDTLRTLNPLKTFDGLRAAMLTPLAAVAARVPEVIQAGLDVIQFPRSWAADLDALAGGVLDLQEVSSPMQSWRQASATLALLKPYSAVATSIPPPPGAAPTESRVKDAVAAHLALIVATHQADAAAIVLAAEADPATGPTLSPPDIELLANAARSEIEAAVVAVRSVYPLETAHALAESLKTTALAVQAAAAAIIAARPPLIERTAGTGGNLRLIAHHWYGDHARAPELARLNTLRLPNFIAAGDRLNAYAS